MSWYTKSLPEWFTNSPITWWTILSGYTWDSDTTTWDDLTLATWDSKDQRKGAWYYKNP